MVTIRDVAAAVNLSVTTVSRALNNHADVAESTKVRIQDAAKLLDYHPNAAARSLQNQHANAIGLVIPMRLHRLYDAFWLEFIGGVIAVCVEHGLDLSLAAAGEPHETALTFQRWARSRRVDGVVICDVQRQDPRVSYLLKHKIPFVAFGRTTGEQQEYAYIDVDGAAGVQQAVDHLTALGHQRIAFLGVDPNFGFSHFRLQGYREALARADLPQDDKLAVEGLNEINAGAEISALLTSENPPTAVFAAADFLALAALRAARQLGLKVPADLSIAVFDDNLPVQHADPPLTAISQPNKRLGEEAAELLLGRIHRPQSALIQRLVVPTLVNRASTAPPPVATKERILPSPYGGRPNEAHDRAVTVS